MKKIGYVLLVLTTLLQGCVNVGASKQVRIPVQPSTKNVLVTSTATVHCRDFIIFFKCKLDIDTKQI